MLLKSTFLILLIKCVPSYSRSSSSTSSDDSSLSSFENVPLHKSEGHDGKLKHVSFANLKKDDDLLPLKKMKKKHEHEKKKLKKQLKKKEKSKKSSSFGLEVREPSSSYICSSSRNSFLRELSDGGGGAQSVGFTYSPTWHKSVENQNQNQNRRLISNGYDKEQLSGLNGEIKNPIGFGWWIFSFNNKENGVGEVGASKTTFKFVNKNKRIIVSVVDLFCRGDSFNIYDSEHLMAQSSRVRPDTQCKKVMISPQEALEDGRWSSVVFELDRGEHEISVKAVDTPFNGQGFAAIRFEELEDEEETKGEQEKDKKDLQKLKSKIVTNKNKSLKVSRKKVCRGYNGYVVISSPFTQSEASTICKSVNTKLASVNEKKCPSSVMKSLEKCIGTDSKAWVSNGQGQQNRVMLLNTKGSLVSENTGKYPIICQV